MVEKQTSFTEIHIAALLSAPFLALYLGGAGWVARQLGASRSVGVVVALLVALVGATIAVRQRRRLRRMPSDPTAAGAEEPQLP